MRVVEKWAREPVESAVDHKVSRRWATPPFGTSKRESEPLRLPFRWVRRAILRLPPPLPSQKITRFPLPLPEKLPKEPLGRAACSRRLEISQMRSFENFLVLRNRWSAHGKSRHKVSFLVLRNRWSGPTKKFQNPIPLSREDKRTPRAVKTLSQGIVRA